MPEEDIVDKINKEWRAYQEKKEKIRQDSANRIENHISSLRKKARFEQYANGNVHP